MQSPAVAILVKSYSARNFKEFDGCDVSILRRRLRKAKRCWPGAADLTPPVDLLEAASLPTVVRRLPSSMERSLCEAISLASAV